MTLSNGTAGQLGKSALKFGSSENPGQDASFGVPRTLEDR